MKNKILIFLTFTTILALVFTGCSKEKLSEKIAENLIEKVAESQSGEDVDIDITEDGVTISNDDGEFQLTGGENLDWPDGAPSEIPEFEGNITSCMLSDTNLMVAVSEVELDAFGAYVGMVEGEGFEQESSYEADGAYYKQYSNGEIELSMTYSEETETLTIVGDWD